MEKTYDLAVVGAGIVGLATAYKYQLQHPRARLAILEKEDRIAAHQTGRNSGVIHSGIYYKPSSYKARNCVNGRHQLVDFAKKYEVPHDICGKIILATEKSELPALDKIYQRGMENGIEGIQMIGPEEINRLEPHARGIKAIRVPVTGIIDYTAFCHKLVERIQAINPQSQVFLNTTVQQGSEEETLTTSRGLIHAKQKVFCAGLQADRMAQSQNAGGEKPEVEIVGFRGDYYQLTEKGQHKVRDLIYPVPDPSFPFLGVHFTRMTDGSMECGPNAVFSFEREGYSKTAFNLRDTWQALTWPGTWKLFFRYPAKGIDEYKRAFSKQRFLKALQKMIPSLTMEDIEPIRSGVRAQALLRNGDLVDDFKWQRQGNAVHVLNAPSPAATACLAIADEIVGILDQ